jgi:hypothetical protein
MSRRWKAFSSDNAVWIHRVQATGFDDLEYLLQIFFSWVLRNLIFFCASGARRAAMPQVIWVCVDSMLPLNEWMGLNRDFWVYPFPSNLLLRNATNSELSLQVSNFGGGFGIVHGFLQLISRSPSWGLICGGFHDRVFTSSMVKTHQECGKYLLRSGVGNLGLTRLNFELFLFPLTLPSLSLKFSRSRSTYKDDRRVTRDSKFLSAFIRSLLLMMPSSEVRSGQVWSEFHVVLG